MEFDRDEKERERGDRTGSCKDDNGNGDKIKQYKEPWRTETVSTTKRFSLGLQRRHIVSTRGDRALESIVFEERAGREGGILKYRRYKHVRGS